MTQDSLAHVLYVSRAAEAVDAVGIADILRFSRDFNARQGVTGMLLYSGTHFAQVLEGPDAVLAALMTSIRRDSRHLDVRSLLWENLGQRRFKGWALGYVCELGVSDLIELLWAAPGVDAERARRLIGHVFQRASPTP